MAKCEACGVAFEFAGYQLYLDRVTANEAPADKRYLLEPVCPNCGKPLKYRKAGLEI